METVKISEFTTPNNIIFGQGSMGKLKNEQLVKDANKICIVSDKGLERIGLVEEVILLLTEINVKVVTFTEINAEPSFQLVGKAIEIVKKEKVDLIIGIGGGSALDVAKTTAALGDKEDVSSYLEGSKVIEKRNIGCILLPTTSGTGAEVTKNAIFEDENMQMKKGIVSRALLPDLAIIDPVLTLSCPQRVSAASGVDAFTHAIESYISVNATEHTRIYAERAMELFPKYISNAVHNGKDINAREGMSWVSLLAGVSLANAGVGAVHALTYPLGGMYKIEHGIANALLMPFVFKVIGKGCKEDIVRVAAHLKLGDYSAKPDDALETVVKYLFSLLKNLNLPTSLKELGIKEEDLPVLAEQAVKVRRLLDNTPYELSQKEILNIYKNTFTGEGMK